MLCQNYPLDITIVMDEISWNFTICVTQSEIIESSNNTYTIYSQHILTVKDPNFWMIKPETRESTALYVLETEKTKNSNRLLEQITQTACIRGCCEKQKTVFLDLLVGALFCLISSPLRVKANAFNFMFNVTTM